MSRFESRMKAIEHRLGIGGNEPISQISFLAYDDDGLISVALIRQAAGFPGEEQYIKRADMTPELIARYDRPRSDYHSKNTHLL